MNNNTNTQKYIKWRYRLSVQRYIRFVARLSDMSMAEILKRLILRARSTSNDKSNYLRHYVMQSEECGKKLLQDIGSDPIKVLVKNFDERFIFGPSNKQEMVVMLNDYCQVDIQKTVSMVEKMCQSGLTLLGHRLQPLSSSFDWQADPKSGKRAWTEGLLDEASAIGMDNADVKYVWEVNRHQFLPMLGRAYWITGDEKYAEIIVDVIERWISSNPAGQGVNWCSHLEVSMRVISWVWVMPTLLTWEKLDLQFVKRWLFSIGQHYYHLKENLSEFTDPTNHLIGETTGLYVLSCCFPQLKDSQSNKIHAKKILEKELVDQNTQDGVNKEQASSYHRFVLDFYIQVLLLARKQKSPLSETSEAQVMAMCEFQSALAGCSGDAPMIGDSDDARGIPFPEQYGWDFKDMSATGAILFNHPEWLANTINVPSVPLWLLGPSTAKYYTEFCKVEASQGMKLFRDGGYCFFSNDGQHGKAELLFDVGSLGLWPNASHGHADALNIIVRLNSNIMLGDPGTGTYFGSETIRNRFRKTSSHNTVTVDKVDQADIYGTFKWINPFSTVLKAAETDNDFSYASACHDGYQRLQKSVMHSRSILSAHSFGWLVLDYLEGTGDHTFDWNFHFTPGTVVTKLGSKSCIAVNPSDDSGMELIFLNSQSNTNELVTVDDSGLWSTVYGKWNASPRVNIEVKGNAPVFQLTLILPRLPGYDSKIAVCDTIQPNKIGRSAFLYTITEIEGGIVLILVNPENENIVLPDDINTDADMLFLQKHSNGDLNKICITGRERYLKFGSINLKCAKTHMVSYIHQPNREETEPLH